MIASDDVRRVTFDKAMRGYRCDDVDDYLKQVADSLDYLTAENDDLQKKLQVLAQRIEQYRAEEDTLHTALINAQRLGENVIKEAKQKAAEILRTANIKAEDREMRARDEVEIAMQRLANVQRETADFKRSLMDMYRKHIELISQIPDGSEKAQQDAAPVQPIQQEEPAPEPAAYAQPEPETAYEAAPAEAKPYQEPAAEAYYEEKTAPAYEEAPAFDEPYEEGPVLEPLPEEKIDTVEFAIAPKADELEEQPEPAPAPRFKPGAGLYGDDTDADEEPAPPKKPARSRSSRAKSGTGRTRKRKESGGDALPAALDAFSGVDFES